MYPAGFPSPTVDACFGLILDINIKHGPLLLSVNTRIYFHSLYGKDSRDTNVKLALAKIVKLSAVD